MSVDISDPSSSWELVLAHIDAGEPDAMQILVIALRRAAAGGLEAPPPAALTRIADALEVGRTGRHRKSLDVEEGMKLFHLMGRVDLLAGQHKTAGARNPRARAMADVAAENGLTPAGLEKRFQRFKAFLHPGAHKSRTKKR